MKEEFLHFLWQYKLFNITALKTTESENVQIVKSGNYNKNTGPDFLNAQLRINHQLWIGNLEIHVKSSDWYAHKHEEDGNYDAVILHVVWEHDSDVFMKNNKVLPTLELKKYVDNKTLNNYRKLFHKKLSWIPCEKQLKEVDSFVLNNWLERLYFERLEYKALFIRKLLEESHNDYEAVLFVLLSRNFGLKVNGDAFESLAQSFNFSVLRKLSFKEHSLSALLFGQGGFLDKEIENKYFLSLKKEYNYIQHTYRLLPIDNRVFQFFRMRPNNFPTIRIAQMIALFHQHQNLFSKLIAFTKLEEFYEFFSIEVNDFWKEHYTFETASKSTTKKLTKPFIDLLIINTILPLKFVYSQDEGINVEDEILRLIQQIKPEKNSIISKFSELGIDVKNAFESQALLELKKNYCLVKSCLKCGIGNSILSS